MWEGLSTRYIYINYLSHIAFYLSEIITRLYAIADYGERVITRRISRSRSSWSRAAPKADDNHAERLHPAWSCTEANGLESTQPCDGPGEDGQDVGNLERKDCPCWRSASAMFEPKNGCGMCFAENLPSVAGLRPTCDGWLDLDQDERGGVIARRMRTVGMSVVRRLHHGRNTVPGVDGLAVRAAAVVQPLSQTAGPICALGLSPAAVSSQGASRALGERDAPDSA